VVVGLLENRVAVVTGGAQGIGLAIASAFIAEGARVVIGDLDLETAVVAAERLGPRAQAVHCDVTSLDSVGELVQTGQELGSLDIMVNNAGITRDASMRKMSGEQFDEVIAVHLRGCWNGTKLAGALMREQDSGSIINMSSLAGKIGNFGQTNYSAAKAGIVGLSKAAAKELAPFGVRVNSIQPGLIRTAMTEAMPAEAWQQKLSEIPMKRAGMPSDVANVALFLASDLSTYLTGTVQEVTGGRFM
jgi:Dehydrogenases with different specificities (related to short-chain alcohol dehydrogenases)